MARRPRYFVPFFLLKHRQPLEFHNLLPSPPFPDRKAVLLRLAIFFHCSLMTLAFFTSPNGVEAASAKENARQATAMEVEEEEIKIWENE